MEISIFSESNNRLIQKTINPQVINFYWTNLSEIARYETYRDIIDIDIFVFRIMLFFFASRIFLISVIDGQCK